MKNCFSCHRSFQMNRRNISKWWHLKSPFHPFVLYVCSIFFLKPFIILDTEWSLLLRLTSALRLQRHRFLLTQVSGFSRVKVRLEGRYCMWKDMPGITSWRVRWPGKHIPKTHTLTHTDHQRHHTHRHWFLCLSRSHRHKTLSGQLPRPEIFLSARGHTHTHTHKPVFLFRTFHCQNTSPRLWP